MRNLATIVGDDAIDLAADLIGPVTTIAMDPDFARGLIDVGREAQDDDADTRAAIIGYIREQVPTLIKTHRSEIVAILAACAGESVEEYAATLTLPKLAADLVGLFAEGGLVDFFDSPSPQETNEEGSESTSTTGDQPLELV